MAGLLVYRGWRLDGPVEEFHAAVDALEADTVPKGYWMKVQASRARRQQRTGASSHSSRSGQ